MKNRVAYKNLVDIFVIEIEEDDIELNVIEGLSEEYYPEPFNIYVKIKNIYKYPDRVKEYAEACQFTNYWGTVGAAPVIRTFAPMTYEFQDIVSPILSRILQRKFAAGIGGVDIAMFTYCDPQAIQYHQYQEPHVDYPPRSIRDNTVLSTVTRGKSLASVIYLDETFGTEIVVAKNNRISSKHILTSDKNLMRWQGEELVSFNSNYYPEGSNSHYEHKVTIGGEYNSAVFYYGDMLHRPYYPGASAEDLKRGRLTQTLFFDDITGREDRK